MLLKISLLKKENYNFGWYFSPLARRKAPAEGQRPEGEGANLDRHLIPYHGKQGESNLASSLFIYLYICINRGPHARAIGILALVNSLRQKLILNYLN